jgi:molecular chaperone GrpE
MSEPTPHPEADAQPPTDELEHDAAQDASPDAAPAEAPSPMDAVEALKTDVARLEDQLLRRRAEFENFRRRANNDRSRAEDLGRAEAVTALLDVVDDLTRTVEAADASEPSAEAFTSLKQGLDLVFQKLIDGLGQLGVQPIAAQGRPFDENLHEALLQQDAPEGVESGTVVTVLQPGYTMGERVLRHARVSVAR